MSEPTPRARPGIIRFAGAFLVALLPSWLKVPIYRRCFGYEIGRGVRIGLSLFVGVRHCQIGNDVRIGHGNLFLQIDDLCIGDHVQVGFLNLFRGGRKIEFGPYVTILRRNIFNAIVELDAVGTLEPVLELGCGSFVTTGHWLDFTARIRVGEHAIVGGRNSSFWTHNRQRGKPIVIGHHCYLGSEVRVAPGVELAPLCVVSLGTVLTGRHEDPCILIGGNPGAQVRKLKESEYPLVGRKNRKDIPDALAEAELPEEVRVAVRREIQPQDECRA